jgi:hypothetical protein
VIEHVVDRYDAQEVALLVEDRRGKNVLRRHPERNFREACDEDALVRGARGARGASVGGARRNPG